MTNEELESSGFVYAEFENGWIHNKYPRYNFLLVDGKATFVREYDNYHGVSLNNISDINDLRKFLLFLL